MRQNQANFGVRALAVCAMTLIVTAANAGPPPPVPGTFTEWNAIALGQPVRDFNPHITVLDRTGNTGRAIDTPWYTIDNRTPGLPCALGHLDPATNILTSWGYGGGVPIGVDVDNASGNVWYTVSGLIIGEGGVGIPGPTARLGFKHPLGPTPCPGGPVTENCFRSFATGNIAGVKVDSAGNGWAAEIRPGAILRVSPAGAIRRYPLPVTSNFREPRYLGFDGPEANLFFTVSSNRTLNRLNLTTNLLTTWVIPGAGTSSNILITFGLFMENDDSVWVADPLGDQIVNLVPSTDTFTRFTKTGMDQPPFVVLSSASQAFLTETLANKVDVLEATGLEPTVVVGPTTATLTPADTAVTPFDILRRPISRVQPPVVTAVLGVDPPGITRFPVPTPFSQPVGITDVVETNIDPLTTRFGIYGSEFAFSSSQIFLFESDIIIAALVIDIDIKPQSFPNCFNNDGKGVIPLAICGRADFDVATIDPSTLALDGLVVAIRGKDKIMCHFEDVVDCGEQTEANPGMPDGFIDLVCQIEDSDAIYTPGDEIGNLAGLLFDGTDFTGSDSICVTQDNT